MRSVLFFLFVCTASAEMVRFQRLSEPKEGAFTVLVPSDWRASGGITRVNPMAANGTLNAIAARIDFTLTSPDCRVVLHWYPETNYFDMRGNPAQSMFPPGSNYNGAPVAPKMNAITYLEQMVLRRIAARSHGNDGEGPLSDAEGGRELRDRGAAAWASRRSSDLTPR